MALSLSIPFGYVCVSSLFLIVGWGWGWGFACNHPIELGRELRRGGGGDWGKSGHKWKGGGDGGGGGWGWRTRECNGETQLSEFLIFLDDDEFLN